MKIEKDKFYKTRAGNKVRIYAVDGVGCYSVHCALQRSDGWQVHMWAGDGAFFAGDRAGNGLDIVSEWNDLPTPLVPGRYKMRDGGEAFVYTTRGGNAERPVIGECFDSEKYWLVVTWQSDGKRYAHNTSGCNLDLVKYLGPLVGEK